MSLLFIRNDITKMDTDAIICPANEELIEGSGTSRAIFQAAGEDALIKACAMEGSCKMGKAVITKGFKLPAKYIIHAVCPRWFDGESNERKLLYSAYDSSLELAKKYGIKSIAFPLLSAGNYGYPKEEALKVACHAITRFLMNNDMDVYLVFYTDEAVALGQKLFPMQKQEIDNDYVYANDENYRSNGTRAWIFGDREEAKARQMQIDVSDLKLPAADKGGMLTGKNLEAVLRTKKPSFIELLNKHVDACPKKKVKLYKDFMSKKQFYELLKNPDIVPKKKTIIGLALGLELTVRQTEELLESAGYCLSQSLVPDMIFRYHISNKRYELPYVNEALFRAGYENEEIGYK